MNLPIDPQILFFAAGLGLGALLAGLALGARFSRRQGATANALDLTRAELERVRLELHEVQGQNQELRAECAAAGATLASERQRFDEQLTLLRETREALNRDFENLANRIFEDKQASFSRTSKLALDSTVDPLRKEIADFRKKVEDAYEKENAERNQLIGQIQQLKVEAQRIGDDAVQLARALKGDSKMQGNWGEVVLERLLEESGLSKGREYDTQVSLVAEGGQRRNPDVIVHLPDNRDIVIDAKVSLVDYERYCRAEDDAERLQHRAAHLRSLRAHINGLSRKAYEQLPGVNTLDFVLIFVPIEAAFMVALEHDHTLFRDAYDQGIILVSPSTLLATLRTVHNIWRYEDQNRNAEKIAIQAGALHDQFVLVIESLDEVGRMIDRSQEAWQQTRKRLVDGRGNLVKRMDDLRRMGARARKALPPGIRDAARLEDADDGGDEREVAP
ncbi:MAG: DNA recombination protein RmuC [Porticoccaceae bacterium]|jgi:DNA recombination protein RmuC|nr:DNA recombination protein RmuC [Porticoccaceae bacterium]HLS98100.1 DNA recombination protein RmuC [Porticoccaceae bacterium]